MRIGIAFDLVPASRPLEGPDDRYEEFDKPETIEALAAVLRAHGHEIILLGDGREFLERVLATRLDFVWNLAEGEGAGRSREARVPAVLEMLEIPYSGSDPLTLAAALDKDVAKRLVRCAGVTVPEGRALASDLPVEQAKDALAGFAARVAFPWLLKPAFEGSSKGIRSRCLVDSEAEALELWLALSRDYGQVTLVEEFIAGDEVTVGIVGNGASAQVIGTMRIVPKASDGRFVYSLDMKRQWSDHIAYEMPARLPEEVDARLKAAALASYAALGCRDLARIDFRIRGGEPYFIEANPLPGLAPDWSDLVILARGAGVEYPELIGRVLAGALDRVGLATTACRGANP